VSPRGERGRERGTGETARKEGDKRSNGARGGDEEKQWDRGGGRECFERGVGGGDEVGAGGTCWWGGDARIAEGACDVAYIRVMNGARWLEGPWLGWEALGRAVGISGI